MVAASVADSLWSQLQLDANKYDIFSHVNDPDKPTSANGLDVYTWILSKDDFYASYQPSSWANSQALKSLDIQIREAIKTGEVKLTVEVNNQEIGLASVDPCRNSLCSKTDQTIVYPKNTASFSVYSIKTTISLLLAAILSAYVFN